MEKAVIALYGAGTKIDEFEARLKDKGFVVRRFLNSPYSDATTTLTRALIVTCPESRRERTSKYGILLRPRYRSCSG